jgi:hypothetical protein
MSTDELGSGPLMQYAHGARARELGRLGRLLRPRAGTIWRDLVRGGVFYVRVPHTADCLGLPLIASDCLGRLLRPRAGTIWRDLVRGGPFSTQLSSPARECSARRPHPFPTGTSTRVLSTAPASIPHRTLECSPRRLCPFPTGPSGHPPALRTQSAAPRPDSRGAASLPAMACSWGHPEL